MAEKDEKSLVVAEPRKPPILRRVVGKVIEKIGWAVVAGGVGWLVRKVLDQTDLWQRLMLVALPATIPLFGWLVGLPWYWAIVFAVLILCLTTMLLVRWAIRGHGEEKKAQLEKETAAEISVRSAIDYVENNTTWRPKRTLVPAAFEIIDEFENAARSGYLRFQGCKDSSSGHELIDTSFWHFNAIDRKNILFSDMGTGRTIRIDRSFHGPNYEGLLIDRHDLEELWPRKETVEGWQEGNT